MAPSRRDGPSLSEGFLKHLGLEVPAEQKDQVKGKGRDKSNGRPRPQTRKERRKEERSNKSRAHRRSHDQPDRSHHRRLGNDRGSQRKSAGHPSAAPGVSLAREASSSTHEESDDGFEGFGTSDDFPSDPELAQLLGGTVGRISKAVRDRLAADDDEIADLERKLGLKGRKSLPKAFRDDGLEDLLGETGEGDEVFREQRKRKAEADEWLAQKRRKAYSAPVKRFDVEDEDGDLPDSLDDLADDSDDADAEAFGLGLDSGGLLSDEEILGASSDEGDADANTGHEALPSSKKRENPYIAPTTGSVAKYVPPSRREAFASDHELISRVRKQVQGLVNRLTESNLVAILNDIEKVYRSNPRQHVTDSLVDVLLVQIAEPTSLPDTLLILLAGFATAAYKVIGTDFGAHLIQNIVEHFHAHYERAKTQAMGDQTSTTKESSNLITFITELYSLKMIGANLIFDYIRLLLAELTELNAELLLRIIRMSGPQLRQDDPLALKDIVALIRPAMAVMGEKNISVRTRFLIDTINDLKNNKAKTGVSASAVVSEHIMRMKKLLGSLNTRKLESTEPLRMGLKDIQDSDKKGKWWLVGASWAGERKDTVAKDATINNQTAQAAQAAVKDADDDLLGAWGETVPDISELEQLAREQGMNTEVRRSIFVTILSAADFEDAYSRLQRLRLNKYDKREISNVLIQCVAAEQHYNAYYTLVARRMCSDRKIQWGFQDSLWKVLKRLGEPFFGEEPDGEEDDEDLDLRRLVNVAKMFGSLMANGAMGLSVLKPLNLPYLQSKTRSVVEVMIVTAFQEAEQQQGKQTAIVQGLFKTTADRALIRGLQYFVRKVIRTSDLIQKSKRRKTLTKLCDVAEKALEEAAAAAAAVTTEEE